MSLTCLDNFFFQNGTFENLSASVEVTALTLVFTSSGIDFFAGGNNPVAKKLKVKEKTAKHILLFYTRHRKRHSASREALFITVFYQTAGKLQGYQF